MLWGKELPAGRQEIWVLVLVVALVLKWSGKIPDSAGNSSMRDICLSLHRLFLSGLKFDQSLRQGLPWWLRW